MTAVDVAEVFRQARVRLTLAPNDLLRDAVYRRLWISILTSSFGAQVTMLALPLTAAQMKSIQSALRASLGKDPEMSARVDPSILGGLKVKVGSKLFDASLKTKLDQMKFALKRA